MSFGPRLKWESVGSVLSDCVCCAAGGGLWRNPATLCMAVCWDQGPNWEGAMGESEAMRKERYWPCDGM